MNSLLLKLEVNIICSPAERRQNIITPLGLTLGENGSVIFSMPSYSLDLNGKPKFDKVKLDIKVNNFYGIQLLKKRPFRP